MENKIQLFEKYQVRTVWDEENEKWWFSVLDIIAVLTDQPDYKKVRNYWKWLKNRVKEEGSNLFASNETVSDTNHLNDENKSVSNTNQLKILAADGKHYKTDVADTEQILRLVQSVPSKKAEPFKQWLARVGRERIDETIDPELSTKSNPQDLQQSAQITQTGASVALNARLDVEQKGGKVISSQNAKQVDTKNKQKKIDDK